MKIKEGFTMRPLGKAFIVIGEGEEQINFNKMISMNESAAYLWDAVGGRDFTSEDLCNLLLEKYDIDRETASKDASALADAWVKAGIVSE